MKRSESGFTLLEIVLVVALFALLAATVFRIRLGLVDEVQADAAIQTVGVAAERARSLSYEMREDSAWGMRAASASMTVFKGASFDARDTEFDEVYDLSVQVSFTGDIEVVFAKGLGVPATEAMVSLEYHDQERSVVIGSGGTISYVQ